jgi:hypothetical protein
MQKFCMADLSPFVKGNIRPFPEGKIQFYLLPALQKNYIPC